MGVVQSFVSPEAAATATAAIIVAGAVGYSITTQGQQRNGNLNLDSSSGTGASNKGKKKKKHSGEAELDPFKPTPNNVGGAGTTAVNMGPNTATATSTATTTTTAVPFPKLIPGDFDVTPSLPHVPSKSKAKDKAKGKAKQVATLGDDGAASSATPNEAPPAANSGSKSKKAKKKRRSTTATSQSNLASGAVASSSKVSTTADHSSSAGFEEKENRSLQSTATGLGAGAIAGRSKESLKSPGFPLIENKERDVGKLNLGSSSARAPTATSLVPMAAQVVVPLFPQDPISHDTDSSWTHVRRSGGDLNPKSSYLTYPSISGFSTTELTTSDAGIVSPMTDDYPSSSVAEHVEDTEEEDEEEVESESLGLGADYIRDTTNTQRRPLAERLLPKPRKTGVEDMLETPDHPTVARVVRVHPLPGEKPASGFSWADYEDVHVEEGAGHDADGEDDGWGVVRSRRSRSDRGPSAAVTNGSASNSMQAEKASSGPSSKKQRQNAKKREAAKSAKADAEAQRLAILANHKQQLEKNRMMEQISKSVGKTPSGGMKAAVDDNGKLVWE